MRLSLWSLPVEKYTEEDWQAARKRGRWLFVLTRAIRESSFFIAIVATGDLGAYGRLTPFALFVCPVIFFGYWLAETDNWDRLEKRFPNKGLSGPVPPHSTSSI